METNVKKLLKKTKLKMMMKKHQLKNKKLKLGETTQKEAKNQ